MAGRKSTKPAASAVEAAKVEAIEPKAEEIKTEMIADPKEAETKKAPAKKAAARTAKTTKTVKAQEIKAEEAKKETKKAAPKAKKAPAKAKNVESILHIQYGGKSYGQEDLMKIARDVWEYDLKHKADELESVELYVKPEENKVYYVMNGESGSFDI